MSFSAAYRSQNTGKTMMFTHQQMFPYWYLSYKSRPKGQQITHSVHNLINRIDVRKYTILKTESISKHLSLLCLNYNKMTYILTFA